MSYRRCPAHLHHVRPAAWRQHQLELLPAAGVEVPHCRRCVHHRLKGVQRVEAKVGGVDVAHPWRRGTCMHLWGEEWVEAKVGSNDGVLKETDVCLKAEDIQA